MTVLRNDLELCILKRISEETNHLIPIEKKDDAKFNSLFFLCLQKIKLCCCFHKKFVLFGFHFEREFYFS